MAQPQFDSHRAIEGLVVTSLIAGLVTFQASISAPTTTLETAAVGALVAAITAFIKGKGGNGPSDASAISTVAPASIVMQVIPAAGTGGTGTTPQPHPQGLDTTPLMQNPYQTQSVTPEFIANAIPPTETK